MLNAWADMEDKILKSSNLLTMPGFKWEPSWECATRKICFLDASQKLPRYLMSCSNSYGFPAENATFSRKAACSFPWFSARQVSGTPDQFPSVFLQSYCPLNFQLLPETTLQSSTLTDFYVFPSAFAVVCLLLLTMMKISDSSTKVLIEKGNCYFQSMSSRKKK